MCLLKKYIYLNFIQKFILEMYWTVKLENKYQLDCKPQEQSQNFHFREGFNHEWMLTSYQKRNPAPNFLFKFSWQFYFKIYMKKEAPWLLSRDLMVREKQCAQMHVSPSTHTESKLFFSFVRGRPKCGRVDLSGIGNKCDH